MNYCTVATALLWLVVSTPAFALDCPEPPRQAQKDWEAQVRAEVGRIGAVRGAELQTRVQTATRDLLGKLPNADKLYFEQMMFSAYCSALRDDRAMAEGDKAAQILEYRRELRRALDDQMPKAKR